jgi:hypothetical protein
MPQAQSGLLSMFVILSGYVSEVLLIWIYQERKQNIYIGNGAQYDSYTITNSTGLEYSGTVEIGGSCM